MRGFDFKALAGDMRVIAFAAAAAVIFIVTALAMMQLRRDHTLALAQAEATLAQQTRLFAAALANRTTNAELEAFWREAAGALPEGVSLALLDGEGVLKLTYPQDGLAGGAAGGLDQGAFRMRVAQLTYSDKGAAQALLAAEPIAGAPFTIVLARPVDDILGPWTAALPIYIGLVIGPAAVALLLAFLVAQEYERAGAVQTRLQRKEDRFEAAFVDASLRAAENERRLARALDAAKQESAQARQRAESAERAKSDLLAATSHELRTPLNAILGFSEIMSSGALGPTSNPKYAEYARDIHRSGKQLLYLVDELLAMATIERGQVHLDVTALPLDGIVHECAAIVRPYADEKQVRLVGKIGKPPPVFADHVSLRQAILNIMVNGVQFTEPGGRVTLTWEADETNVYLSIADTGVGIPDPDLQRLAAPFERANGSSGLGLGLAVAKSLLEMQGATIAIDSEEGSGTSVVLSLPRAQPEDLHADDERPDDAEDSPQSEDAAAA